MSKEPEGLERFAHIATAKIGTPTSIVAHTIFFGGIFVLRFFGFSSSDVLLILTTLVSLEAIYLSIFIQISLNMNTARLSEVSEDVEEIQEDVEEIQEDVEEIQEDVGDIEADVKDISEEVEDITEEMAEDELEADKKRFENRQAIEKVEQAVLHLLHNLEDLKEKNEHLTKHTASIDLPPSEGKLDSAV
jgi:low affinity Fe/Cu permease